MNAIRLGDEQAHTGAYFRGLDLVDATVAGLTAPTRRRELLRVCEQYTKQSRPGKWIRSLTISVHPADKRWNALWPDILLLVWELQNLDAKIANEQI
jgi:hypothetical protein